MFDALSNGFGGIVKLMEASPNIARTIGETAALVCWHASGTEPGRTLPTKVFAMHDGVLA